MVAKENCSMATQWKEAVDDDSTEHLLLYFTVIYIGHFP